jgi:hypothetical protein
MREETALQNNNMKKLDGCDGGSSSSSGYGAQEVSDVWR